jgi:hypothetical protein
MTSNTTTTRRAILAGTAAVSTLAVPTSPVAARVQTSLSASAAELRLFEIEKEVRELALKIRTAGDTWDAAEKAAFDWDRQNPKPVMPDFPSSRNGWQNRVAQVLNDGGTSADAVEAILGVTTPERTKQEAEHVEAVTEWEARRGAARNESGYLAAKNSYERLIDDEETLFEEAAEIRPATFGGILCKARLARACFPDVSETLAGSLVDDLLAMQEVQS